MVIDSSSIVVTPNSYAIVSLTVSEFPTDPYTLTLAVSEASDAISAEIIESDNSGLLNIGPVNFISPSAKKTIQLNTGQEVHAKIKITRNENTETGAVTVLVDNEKQVIRISGSETSVVNAPEFPTVALPVAAILGLVFIFGRKKDGL